MMVTWQKCDSGYKNLVIGRVTKTIQSNPIQ